MAQLDFTDEKSFITEKVEFDDEFYNLAKSVYEQSTIKHSKIFPLMVRSDKKSLCFFIDNSTSRLEGELNRNVYRITIENLDRNV